MGRSVIGGEPISGFFGRFYDGDDDAESNKWYGNLIRELQHIYILARNALAESDVNIRENIPAFTVIDSALSVSRLATSGRNFIAAAAAGTGSGSWFRITTVFSFKERAYSCLSIISMIVSGSNRAAHYRARNRLSRSHAHRFPFIFTII